MSAVEIRAKDIRMVRIADVVPNAKNRNIHPPEQIERLAEIIRYQGFRVPIVISNRSGMMVAGHGRLLAAKKLGLEAVPALYQDFDSEEQEYAAGVSDNSVAAWAELDLAGINADIGDLGPDFDIDLLGIQDFTVDVAEKGDGGGSAPATLADRFLVPPFSVLDARQGYWQERKRKWLALGIKSEEGRGAGGCADGSKFKGSKSAESEVLTNTTSVFDPVLCELAYRWFSPVGGVVLDPFAGGSVRGVVASKLLREYVGVELRAEQVEANRLQGESICPERPPVWKCGDSARLDEFVGDLRADFLFSCPPYADLEVYSDDPADISNMPYPRFREVYSEIIRKSVAVLKEDRFAVFVVGEVRDKRSGNYYGFVGDTVQAFRDAGASFYNEAVLVTMVGNTSLTTSRFFPIARKLGKTHQNVLVFCKGDPKAATAACGVVDVTEALNSHKTEAQESHSSLEASADRENSD